MENYFVKLNSVKCEVEKKNGLNYISWSDAWSEVKKLYPKANYRKVKNDFDNSYLFRSGTGGSVEVEVTIDDVTHKADLAVTDFKNQEIKYDNIKSTDIQNTLQRAFAKAIAMHGIGLYVYRGEDLPEALESVNNEYENIDTRHTYYFGKKPFKKAEFNRIAKSYNDGGITMARQEYAEIEKTHNIELYHKERIKLLMSNDGDLTEEKIAEYWTKPL